MLSNVCAHTKTHTLTLRDSVWQGRALGTWPFTPAQVTKWTSCPLEQHSETEKGYRERKGHEVPKRKNKYSHFQCLFCPCVPADHVTRLLCMSVAQKFRGRKLWQGTMWWCYSNGELWTQTGCINLSLSLLLTPDTDIFLLCYQQADKN